MIERLAKILLLSGAATLLVALLAIVWSILLGIRPSDAHWLVEVACWAGGIGSTELLVGAFLIATLAAIETGRDG